MLNNVTLQGRITKELELKQFANGSSVSFIVAVNRNYTNKSTGEYEADFIRCSAHNKTAEHIVKYASKGKLITLTGQIKTGSYVNNVGNTVYTTEVQVNNADVFTGNPKAENNNINNIVLNPVTDDDLPF